jgi:hypothetical protein
MTEEGIYNKQRGISANIRSRYECNLHQIPLQSEVTILMTYYMVHIVFYGLFYLYIGPLTVVDLLFIIDSLSSADLLLVSDLITFAALPFSIDSLTVADLHFDIGLITVADLLFVIDSSLKTVEKRDGRSMKEQKQNE